MLRIRLIGEMALEIDGTAAPPPASRRARSLLAWLALHPGLHARADVAARFWPDVLDASARTNLRSALLTLRIELGEGELLPGLDDHWVFSARDDHRDRLIEAYGRLAAAAERAGDRAAAVRWTRRLVSHDPLSEDAHRELIRRLAEAGDRPVA